MTDDRHRRDDERALTLALFRYGVIADLAEREDFDPGERTARIRELAAQTHYRPGHGPVKVSERTLYAWQAAFREGGLTALLPVRRKDLGARRVLSDEVVQRAVQLRKEQGKRTTRTLLDILRLEGLLSADAMPHRSTLDRHLALLGASRRQLRVLGEKRTIKMVVGNFGDLWVGDYHHGPVILGPDGQPVTAKLGAVIDHCTRWPVADRYYLSEDVATLRDTLLRALLTWGPPKKFYVDRGSVYRAEQLAWSLSRLPRRCALVHSRAYYSQGRGVIERWWQSANEFEAEVEVRDELLDLHELNRFWEAWKNERYCNVVHGELGRTPAEAVAEATPRPIDPEVARELFLVRARRKVHKKDSCARLKGRRFLCESFLRDQWVQLRYDPRDLSEVLVFSVDGRRRIQRAFPQQPNATPEPHPEPEVVQQSVDYLALLREEFDRKLLEHARPLSYARLELDETFNLERFRATVRDLAGLRPRPVEADELAVFWDTFGPLPESLVRIATEHAVRLHGRGRHLRVYLNAVRTLVLAHWQKPEEER